MSKAKIVGKKRVVPTTFEISVLGMKQAVAIRNKCTTRSKMCRRQTAYQYKTRSLWDCRTSVGACTSALSLDPKGIPGRTSDGIRRFGQSLWAKLIDCKDLQFYLDAKSKYVLCGKTPRLFFQYMISGRLSYQIAELHPTKSLKLIEDSSHWPCSRNVLRLWWCRNNADTATHAEANHNGKWKWKR